MKIGLAGTVSVGKTTMVNELSNLIEFQDYKFFTERSVYLRDLGVPLNMESTLNGQMIFAAERSRELFHDNFIADRSIWDVASFTMNSKLITPTVKGNLVNSIMMLKDQYDVIFYVSPEGVKLEDNGIRITDSDFRNEIDKTITYLLQVYPPKRLIKLKGPTPDRIRIILNYINER